jgi:hypothetical protein
MGTRSPPPPSLDPPLCRLGLHVSSVKLKTLNAFYGYSRSFAHPKPYIKNDRHEKINNPVSFVFYSRKLVLLGNSHATQKKFDNNIIKPQWQQKSKPF